MWTRKLYIHSEYEIKRTSQEKIWNLQQKLTRILLRMEFNGIRIDSNYCKQALNLLNEYKPILGKKIFDLANREFNILSPKQIGEVFTDLGISSPEITNKGNPSWNETALFQIDHPLSGLIREYRTLGKLGSTYLEPFVDYLTLHGSFCNWGTATGRLSSRDPNLQNIPRFITSLSGEITLEQSKEVQERIEAIVRARKGTSVLIGGATLSAMTGFTTEKYYSDEDSERISIRRLFIPRPGYKLISYDYSQMEVRTFISYFSNQRISDLMKKEGFDFHKEAAKIGFNKSGNEPDFHFYRQMAKAITFGIIYGIGNARLASQLGKTEEEAKEYKKAYFKAIEGSREFIRETTNNAQLHGYVINKYGRKYWIDSGKEYVAVNYLVQGTSADILTERMIALEDYFKAVRGKMLIQIHDELICEVPEDSYVEISKKVKDILEENSLDIPLVVDVSLCDPSWAHKKDLVLI